MKYLLDSTVCVDVLRRRGRAAERVARLSPDDLAISAINLAEIEFGVFRSRNPREERYRIEAFLAIPIRVLPFDDGAARVHARLRDALRSQPIGALDLCIASVAALYDLTVVTRSVREFARVPGLAVEDWTA